MDMKSEFSDVALLELAKEGFDPVFGARRWCKSPDA